MAGIFSDGGVTANAAVNSVRNVDLVTGCKDLWYAPKCNPKFDPNAANAVLAEIMNLLKCFNWDYDCDRLDNLCQALKPHGIAYNTVADHLITANNNRIPSAVNDVTIDQGTFTVPNTYRDAIQVMLSLDLAIGFRQLIQNTDMKFVFELHDLADFSDGANIVYFEYFNWNPTVGNVSSFIEKQSLSLPRNIPAGGRQFYWRMLANSSVPDSWELVQSRDATTGCKITAYGVYAATYDT